MQPYGTQKLLMNAASTQQSGLNLTYNQLGSSEARYTTYASLPRELGAGPHKHKAKREPTFGFMKSATKKTNRTGTSFEKESNASKSSPHRRGQSAIGSALSSNNE